MLRSAHLAGEPASFPRALRRLLGAATFGALAAASFAAPGQQFPPIKPAHLEALAAALPRQARVQPQRPRRLLVFYRTEGFVHSSIPVGNEMLRRMGEQTGAFTVEISDDMAMFEPAQLERFDAVVFNNTTQLKFENPVHRAALLDFVARGRGLAGLHAGSDNFPTWPEGQALMGGVFHSHPWVAGDTVAVKLDEPEHPLTHAFHRSGFWIREEIYQIVGDYSREKQRVVLSLDMSKPENARPANKIVRTDGDFPISWIKQTAGGGRVFYTSLGHREDIYFQAEVVQHYLDGLQFALGDLAMDAVPSARLASPPDAALAPGFVLALQDRGDPEAARRALEALKSYETGGDRGAVAALEDFVQRVGAVNAGRELEAPLLQILASATAPAGARDAAARLLNGVASVQAVPSLKAALGDPSAAGYALRVLFGLPGEQAEAALASGLARVEGPDRLALIGALGRRRVAAATAELARLAEAADLSLATAAVVALGNIGTGPALQALNQASVPAALSLDRQWAQIAAAGRLLASGTGTPAKQTLLALTGAGNAVPIRLGAVRALVAAGAPEAWEVVAVMLRDGDPQVRLTAAATVGGFEDPAAIGRAAALFATLAPDARAALLAAVAHRATAEGRALVRKGMEDADETVRLAALRSLGAIGDVSSLPPLVQLAKGRDVVAETARAALARLPGDEVSQALLARLGPADEAERVVLFETLGERLFRPAFPAALAATRDRSATVRRAAFEAAGRLAQPADLATLLNLLGDTQNISERRFVQRALFAAVSSHPDETAVAVLVMPRLEGARGEERDVLLGILAMLELPQAVEVLARELKSADPERRKETLRILGNTRTFAARPLLFDAAARLEDATEKVLAVRALLDLVRETTRLGADEKVSDYRAIWKLAVRPEEKAAVVAALRRMEWNKPARAFLAELGEAPAADT